MIPNDLKNELLAFAKECREKHIPVVREKTAEILCKLIENQCPKNVLELGTAVGYSATLMLKTCGTCNLVTVDVNADMCKKAYEVFVKYNVENRAQIVNDDILNFLQLATYENNAEFFTEKNSNNDILATGNYDNLYKTKLPEKFDLIFLDGPKGQYIKYYPYLKKLIAKGGVIFCDDVLYFGMVLDDSKVIHKKITIVRNLREFLKLAQNDDDFESELLDVEDGILILKSKHKG